MSTIFDLLYREYCRARLAEMRKQVLIPVASDEILEARSGGGDGATQPRRTKPPLGALDLLFLWAKFLSAHRAAAAVAPSLRAKTRILILQWLAAEYLMREQ